MEHVCGAGRGRPGGLRRSGAGVALLLGAAAALAQGETAALADLLGSPGSAGVGAVALFGASPYRDGGTRLDLQPLYLYEGERLFLRSDRIGIKFAPDRGHRLELLLQRRTDGFPRDTLPPVLEGMSARPQGLDLALAWRADGPGGQWYAQFGHDVGRASRGSELALGWHGRFDAGRWALQPALGLTRRSARLNDHLFGVRPEEATVLRPAYKAGDGVDLWAALFATYAASERWRLFGGMILNQPSAAVRASPLAEDRMQPALALGAVYGFGSGETGWASKSTPTVVRVMHGSATEDGCHLVRIVTLRCADLNRSTPTRVTAVHVGRTFIDRLNGWPLGFVGYVGLLHHDDRPYQRSGLQVDLYMKAYFDGLPWRDRVRTRLGFGFGLSIADPVPYEEVSSQAARGRATSRVLNYLDPSVDVSLGDLVGRKSLKDTYVGIGVSHRSGIFAWSRLLGRVNGGSNYIVGYVEQAF
jgi:outer membrane protein